MEHEIKQQREKLRALYDAQQQQLSTIILAKQNGQLSEKQGQDILNSPDYLALQKQISAENKVLQELIREQDRKAQAAALAKKQYWQERSAEALAGIDEEISQKKAVYEKANNLHSDLMSKIGALRKRRIAIAARLDEIPLEHAQVLLSSDEPDMGEFDSLTNESKSTATQIRAVEQAITIAAQSKEMAYKDLNQSQLERGRLELQIRQREQKTQVQKAVQAFAKAGGEGGDGGLFDALLSLIDAGEIPKTPKFQQRISWERSYYQTNGSAA